MPQKILIFLLLITCNLVHAQKQEPILVLPGGQSIETSEKWVMEDLMINEDASLIFSKGRRDNLCIVWEVKSKKKLREYESLLIKTFNNNRYLALVNLDSLIKIDIISTKDLKTVNQIQFQVNNFILEELFKTDDWIFSTKIVLPVYDGFEFIDLISSKRDTLLFSQENILSKNDFRCISLENKILLLTKHSISLVDFSNEKKQTIYNPKDNNEISTGYGSFYIDSIRNNLFFEEVIKNQNDSTVSTFLNYIDLNNHKHVSKLVPLKFDYSDMIGSNENKAYYKLESFSETKDNSKILVWDLVQNSMDTNLILCKSFYSFGFARSLLFRIKDPTQKIHEIEDDSDISYNQLQLLINSKYFSEFTLDGETQIDFQRNKKSLVLLNKNKNISEELIRDLFPKNKNQDSIRLIIFTSTGITAFNSEQLPFLKNITSYSLFNDTILLVSYDNNTFYPNWAIVNLHSKNIEQGFNFYGTGFNVGNSDYGFKLDEKSRNLKSSSPLFDLIEPTSGKINKSDYQNLNSEFLVNTFNEVTSYYYRFVNESDIDIYNDKNEKIFELKNQLNRNFEGVKTSKNKRFLILNDRVIDLEKGRVIYIKNNNIKCSFNSTHVMEDTLENKLYMIEQIPRKKQNDKYIYFNINELVSNKTIHKIRIKNELFKSELNENWENNNIIIDEFNMDLKSKKNYLNDRFNGLNFNCFNFNLQDPIWSLSPFDFFIIDLDGNIVAKKNDESDSCRECESLIKINGSNGKIIFSSKRQMFENFCSVIDDPTNNQLILYQNIGNAIFLNRENGSILKRNVINKLARNKSANYLKKKFLLTKNILITDGLNQSTQIRRSSDGKLLYSFFDISIQTIDENGEIKITGFDRLFIDEHNRFDGTPGAIEKLYFVCGLEVVELNQIKDSLYVPNLVQRIMNGENLDHLPKLSELNICGVTPVVEPLENDKSGKQGYRIIPRSGGVGDVDVYINGVVRLSTNSKKLKRKDGNYMLYVEKELLELYQIPGEELKVKVIAKTANNSLSSRGVVIDIESDEKTTFKKPALHAIMIGVDDYKGDGLDLNYAAKDANDLQTVLQKSAQKFFNIDDTSRVHFYNLTVNRSGANGNEKIKGITPDRTNIVNTIAEIEKTSKPEDILLLFFAGHGEIVDKDQLLLLTSESSRDDFKGLRMRELLELLNKVPAGKRVLILDACHSGAAIKGLEITKLSQKDDKTRDVKEAERQSQRLKELDKLASKSGFAIITASSSDQKALELPQYEHGLMTYALLNAMLNNKSSLDENNQLQLDKWLMATEEEVKKLNQNQSAERMVPVTFTLGKIDDEVRSSIVLKEIPTVYVSNVLNIDLGFDDQKIKSQLINYFSEKSRGTEKTLFVSEIEQPNSVQVNVVYSISKNQITLKATLLKNNEVFKRFEKSGNLTAQSSLLNELMLLIEKEVE